MEDEKFPKSDSVDIMIFSEGTYPYIKGGVSSWILQLIKGLPEFSFGVCFVGATPYIDGKPMRVSYELPPNLKHLEVHYLFDNDPSKVKSKRRQGSKSGFEEIEKLYKLLSSNIGELPNKLKNIDFYIDEVKFEDFLFSRRAWKMINDLYMQNCPDIPFIDYFWTVRNIHRPIWILANIVKNLPETKIYHSPSTGYAGFLGTLASYSTDRPFVLTEHGIYTRERKIDMLSADWIEYKKPTLLQQPEEYNYIKKMWVSFFEKIGLFCYHRANYIFSLYKGARDIQISFGADEKKCAIVPNGVDVDRLQETIKKRKDPPKPIITLIGRVVPIKDIKTFIRAIKITSQYIPEVEGWIVGAVEEDREYVLECQQMAVSLGLKQKEQEFVENKTVQSFEELIDSKEKIKFFGHCDIRDILPLSALQTLTSISEGMPLVILEGFAAGVPCVATNVGSCKDLIEGGLNEDDILIGKAGAITDIANPEALAKEYIRFLDFSSGLWHKAQKNAITRVKRYYRQDMFLSDYRFFYNQLYDKRYNDIKPMLFSYHKPNKIPYKKEEIKRFLIKNFTPTYKEVIY